VRKWNEPQPQLDVPPIAEPAVGEKVRLRARAFRRWIDGGAEPGGLRALAGEQAGRAQAAEEPTRVRNFARTGGADEAHLPPPDAVQQPPSPGASHGEQARP
jgi:hypothetical protein